jgi:hypothetical protein
MLNETSIELAEKYLIYEIFSAGRKLAEQARLLEQVRKVHFISVYFCFASVFVRNNSHNRLEVKLFRLFSYMRM